MTTRCVDEAVAVADGQPLVVGKSIGSLAAERVAALGLPGAWATPLLTGEAASVVRRALEASPDSQLLVGGTADETWDPAGLPARHRVVEVDGADHGLVDPADAVRSVDLLRTWVESLERYVGDVFPD